MELLIPQKLEVFVETYPNHASLKGRLLEDVKNANFNLSYQTNVHGKHSDWQTSSPNITFICEWVEYILNQKYGLKQNGYWHRLNWFETWFAIYDKDEYARKHQHELSIWSFVYFIDCPRGSSPLVFSDSGKRIKAEEGKLVIFPGHLRHHVPKNKCEGRIVLAGNCIQSQVPIKY
tara:strand:+ start:949 stop:1476 length:528 start_codon:yes stop_codon:yes gene_type:complete